MSKHPKNIGEYTDMEKLAEDIGNLHYEQLGDLLSHLAKKLEKDGLSDKIKGRNKLAEELDAASEYMGYSALFIKDAWKISKPFMKEK